MVQRHVGTIPRFNGVSTPEHATHAQPRQQLAPNTSKTGLNSSIADAGGVTAAICLTM